jgi:glycosyltransferase involved in cell wall biosynthesis
MTAAQEELELALSARRLLVAHVNFYVPPAAWEPDEVLRRWPSLPDVAEAVNGNGSHVAVIQLATRTAHLVHNGVDYHFMDTEGATDAAGRGRLVASLLATIRPDIIHVHGLGFAEEACAVSSYMPSIPIVFQDHADRPPRWWRRTRWLHWLEAAAGVAFTAPELARPFVEAGLLGPQTQLFAIPESSSHFSPGGRAQARSETGLYGDPCAIWVGHLSQGKDPLTVLEGIARASTRLPDLHLWCVFGNAPLLSRVQRLVERDARLAGRVHLLGNVQHARVESLMRASDLFVSGTRSESCGYALLEAFACGTTPVVTDIPSFRALTASGSVGHLWPCGDADRFSSALIDAAEHPMSQEQVRAHFDASLSFAVLGRRWTSAYEKVLERRRKVAL